MVFCPPSVGRISCSHKRSSHGSVSVSEVRAAVAMKKVTPAVLSGDRKGIMVAALCFLHCVLGPVLLWFAGFSSLIGVSERMEPLFVLSSIAIGTATLVPGYRHKHGRFSC